MLTTLVCSALTVVFFIMSQLGEGQWRWMTEDKNLEFTSAFFTGLFSLQIISEQNTITIST